MFDWLAEPENQIPNSDNFAPICVGRPIDQIRWCLVWFGCVDAFQRKESGCPIRDSSSHPGAGIGSTPYQVCLG